MLNSFRQAFSCRQIHRVSFISNTVRVLLRYATVQHLADKAKLLRKEAKGVQHMAMKDEVCIGALVVFD